MFFCHRTEVERQLLEENCSGKLVKQKNSGVQYFRSLAARENGRTAMAADGERRPGSRRKLINVAAACREYCFDKFFILLGSCCCIQ